ncbi:MAG: hypothetical protein J5I93_29455, partial [Pirellulaceae bacterium]|nr:hypothetical protein [Pirellulaceae bacterium]
MSETARGLVCGSLALTISLLLLALLRPLRGTTLVAPWAWTLLAAWTVAAVELAAVTVGRDWSAGELTAWRFLAATAALCPGMAVLGAKRPQDRAWSFIVAALWGMLGLPALKVLLLPAVATLSLHPAQSWFLAVLGVAPVVNWLPTRYWLSALLVGAGLAWLVWP